MSKYDGHRFTNYSTANGLDFNYINDIYEMAPNRFLVAENNGTTDVVEHGEIIRNKRIGNIVVNKILVSQQGQIVGITDDSGLCVLKNNTWRRTGQGFYGTQLVFLSDSSLLAMAGEDSFLKIVNATSLTPEAEIVVKKHVFTMLYTDRQNRTWIGTNARGVLILEREGASKKAFKIGLPPKSFYSPLFAGTKVISMLQDDKDDYWIGTVDGLVKIQANGQQRVYTRHDGLPSNNILCLFQDREKNIWAGTKEGLCKIVTVNNVQVFEIGQESGSYASQQLWKASEKELFAFNGTSIKKVNTATWAINDWPHAAITPNGAIYPGKNSFTFFSYQPSKPTTVHTNNNVAQQVFKSGITAQLLVCAARDEAGNMYYGAHPGIICHSANNQPTDTLIRTRITTLDFDHKGNLWAGTWSKGFYRIRLENGQRIPEDVSRLWPDKSIRSTFEDREGNCWIGLRYGGLVMLKQYDTSRAGVRYFNKKNGLSSDWIRCITQDKEGNIWVGTNQGLDKLIPGADGYRIYNFGQVNNFSPAIYGIAPLDHNILWCTSSIGLIRLEDAHLDTVALYKTVITAVIPGSFRLPLSRKQLQNSLSLGYLDNSIQFEYAVPSFINEKQIYYSYRLMGSNDTSWSVPSSEHSVSYASLQHGSYRFQVRSLGWDGMWGEPAEYSFRILPPFWKTWWFFLLIAIFIVTTAYAFYRYRLSQAMKLQSIRTRIATDLHDEIGSTLTNISILSELSRQNLQQPDDAQKFLGRIAEEVDTGGQALDDIIWSVNVRNDSFEELMRRMRRYTGELFDASRVQYELEFDENLAGTKLNMELRRDIYLVYKEALNNIHKHAAASCIKIELLKQDSAVVMLVEDNGKGFEATETHRNGLRNMRNRTAKWKGTIVIDSGPGKGTKIKICFPAN